MGESIGRMMYTITEFLRQHLKNGTLTMPQNPQRTSSYPQRIKQNRRVQRITIKGRPSLRFI